MLCKCSDFEINLPFNGWSNRIQTKRRFKERFQSYRMIYLQTKFEQKQASKLELNQSGFYENNWNQLGKC